jgi:hypothetical protein
MAGKTPAETRDSMRETINRMCDPRTAESRLAARAELHTLNPPWGARKQ